jgi:sec-independent protein translocase protein TatA
MNFGDLFDSPWKVLIVAVVVLVLFGSRKLPDAARSLGRSMRILKTEVSKLHDDETPEAPSQAPAQALPTPSQSHQQQLDQLQQQVRDLQQAATSNGSTAADQTSKQPG